MGASFPPFDSNEDNESIAYAFDLATSARRDLPGLDPERPFVTSVDGGDAAGSGATVSSNRRHAVSWDLSAGAPVIRDHGTLGGWSLSVAAVRDGVVVGHAGRPVDDRERPFAVDLRASRPRLNDLGTLGGYSGAAAAVSGRTVVDWSSTASTPSTPRPERCAAPRAVLPLRHPAHRRPGERRHGASGGGA